jgi:hypothetical protein
LADSPARKITQVPSWALLLLVGLKVWLDLRAHLKEHAAAAS